MITFLICFTILILGYILYGNYIDKVLKLNNRNKTPAVKFEDDIDYVPMSWDKVLLIQFLNIAGTGPVFGAIMGALFGPVAFLWITFGSIFIGGVHDYLSGVISMKHDGISVSEIVGIYLGQKMKHVMRIFSLILLILVGTVFITTPAGLLAVATGISKKIWMFIIIIYYIFATIFPIEKIFGRLYPIFGAVLVFMALGLVNALVVGNLNGSMTMVELSIKNLHPSNLPIFPYLFITIACGAVSGFHATQSPMMARCVARENDCKPIFFGAMIIEGIIALVWCAVTIAFFENAGEISYALNEYGGQSGVVSIILRQLLGTVGSILAILGVVACPITSGDTAFRSARLTIADALKIKQDKMINRILIAIPLFIVGIYLTTLDFDVIWRYFAWSNQTLAAIFLWAATIYLLKNNKNYLIALIPAAFMSAVCSSYILQASEGFKIAAKYSNVIGVVVALSLFIFFLYKKEKIINKFDD